MYIGNTPAENYASFLTETFTVSATANYTLSHAVTNENDIRLVINGVVQQPGSGKAYTASGTTLTLTSATVSGDVMYAVYLGRALQTVNAPNASVGSDQAAPTIITGQTAEATVATDDTILIHDTSASALRKMTRANFVSGIGGANTPAFQATLSSNQSISNNTPTKVQFNSENFDTDATYDPSTNYRFTPAVAGKYHVTARLRYTDASAEDKFEDVYIYKNGSGTGSHPFRTRTVSSSGRDKSVEVNAILDLDADDYLEVYTKQNSGSSIEIAANDNQCLFQAFKLIT